MATGLLTLFFGAWFGYAFWQKKHLHDRRLTASHLKEHTAISSATSTSHWLRAEAATLGCDGNVALAFWTFLFVGQRLLLESLH